eukprot:132494-Rhodomonas_salina.1
MLLSRIWAVPQPISGHVQLYIVRCYQMSYGGLGYAMHGTVLHTSFVHQVLSPYAMSGTDPGYAAISAAFAMRCPTKLAPFRDRYAVSGTDIGYAAPRSVGDQLRLKFKTGFSEPVLVYILGQEHTEGAYSMSIQEHTAYSRSIGRGIPYQQEHPGTLRPF